MAKKPARKPHPDATGSAPKPTKSIEPKPTPEGRLWFDEQGHLNQSGPVPLSRYLGGLSDQLRLFLTRLDSCERTDTGGYLLRDARAGNLGGMRVLWDNVVLLAQASIAKTLPAMTPDQHAAYKRDGVLATVTAPTRNAQPLTDALRQLLFLILYNADGSWVSEIPSATVAKIRTIGDELTQHRTAWERSEGGTTRTPTVSVSPDLLDRLQRAAAAVDPGAIDRAAERAAAKALEAMKTRDDPGIGGTETDWRAVQGWLLGKRERNEPYTSLRKLCAELKCSDATIRKAIDESETLKGWQARSTGTKAAPKATDLGEVVRDNARQTTEPAPDDVLPDDDVDATMARLIEQAKPDERAKLNALDDAGRRALVATYQSQHLDDEPSPLEPDKPGERPRKVKQHKRA